MKAVVSKIVTTVYADILILVNIYTDYFILLAVKRFFHLTVKPWRMLLASTIGGICGLSALLSIHIILRWLLLIAFAAIICFTAFYDKSIPLLIKATVTFVVFGLIFSGIVIVLIQTIGLNATVIGGMVYFDISPIVLIVFTGIAYLTSTLFEHIRGRSEVKIKFSRIIIENKGEKTEIFGKVNTGSNLKEPFSGTPVIVVQRAAVERVLPQEVDNYLNHKITSGGFRLVPYKSLGGGGLLPAFKPNCIYFKDSEKYINCFLAVYDGQLSATGYNALINPDLTEFM